jgi:uncharacterized protein YfaP (DUF2135 family)
MLSRALVVGVAALTVAALAGCTRSSSDSPLSPSPVGRLNLQDLAASASVDEAQGARRAGQAPPSTGGPRITVSGNQTVITGGTLSVTIDANGPFDTVYVTVGGRALGLIGESAGGIDGYYEIRLPGPQTSATVLLAFPQEIPLNQFELLFAVVSPSGAVGPYASLSTTVLGVGTGDVQVTLSWDVDSDVDLHVVAPGGEEIYYGRRRSSTGGELDLDSNAACNIDGVRNENITWPVGRAPQGQYTVRVNYWSNCGVSRTNYTVRINNGGAGQIVTGSFTGPGDRGGLGAGTVVATFERTSGPTAAIVAPQLLAQPDATK